jgi:hypothetical protein
MARFLLVLQPQEGFTPNSLLDALDPLLRGLSAEVDHRTPAHLSALLKGAAEAQRMQLFADVQVKEKGLLLELVLLSREAMVSGAPATRRTFEQLVDLCMAQLQPSLLVFRSDRDGALPA